MVVQNDAAQIHVVPPWKSHVRAKCYLIPSLLLSGKKYHALLWVKMFYFGWKNSLMTMLLLCGQDYWSHILWVHYCRNTIATEICLLSCRGKNYFGQISRIWEIISNRCKNFNLLLHLRSSNCFFDTPGIETQAFFLSNTFISKSRLKLAKN